LRALDATLKRMADEGLSTLPARKGPLPSPRWKPIRPKGKPLSRTIIEDREDFGKRPQQRRLGCRHES
jgi:hypothetical protein